MPNVSQWAFQIDIPTRFQIFEIFFPHKVWLLLHLNFDVNADNVISADEFENGIIRLQGSHRALIDELCDLVRKMGRRNSFMMLN